MSRKVLVSLLLVGALTIAAVVGVAAYQTSQAAAPALSGLASGLAHGGAERGPGGGVADEDLATALGITTDELTAAYTEATSAAIKQAVEAGLITQAQADEMIANGNAFPFGGRWGGWLGDQGIDYDALLANALGISTDELQAARLEASNARIDQAVTDGTMTQEQADLMKGKQALYADQTFIDAMQAAFKSAVQDAVDRGVITQAQADLILANSADGFGGHGMGMPGMGGPGMGNRGGPRGGHGGWEGGPPSGGTPSGGTPSGGTPPSAPPADAPATAPTTGG